MWRLEDKKGRILREEILKLILKDLHEDISECFKTAVQMFEILLWHVFNKKSNVSLSVFDLTTANTKTADVQKKL